MCTYISINAHFTRIKETMPREYNREPSKLTPGLEEGTQCAPDICIEKQPPLVLLTLLIYTGNISIPCE